MICSHQNHGLQYWMMVVTLHRTKIKYCLFIFKAPKASKTFKDPKSRFNSVELSLQLSGLLLSQKPVKSLRRVSLGESPFETQLVQKFFVLIWNELFLNLKKTYKICLFLFPKNPTKCVPSICKYPATQSPASSENF